jgi:peptide/nickel transport system substrate-binding protein
MAETGKKIDLSEFRMVSRRDFLRIAMWTGGGTALASFLASCAPLATATSTQAAPGVPTATSAPTQVAVAATATPNGPKILTFRLQADIQEVDPCFMIGAETFLIDVVYSGLVFQKPASYDWTRDLAEEIMLSADGLTVDFTLKQGVMFHKGYGELTTDDVKYSFERIADPTNKSPYSSDWLTLDHVQVIDKYHGQIILKSPFAPLFNSTLPVNSGRIVCKAYTEKVGQKVMALSPIGTGPYIFDSWTPNQLVVLKRDPAYHGDAPYFDEIHCIPITDDLAAETALQAGELDSTSISLGSTQRFLADSNFNTDKKQGLLYFWIGMNVENPKLADINVRQAIRYGVDINQILTGVYFNQAERANSMIPPGLIGFWKDAPQYDRDVTKAKDFMSKAGLKSLDLTYTCANDTQSKAMAEIVQQNLADVGITLTINQMDAASFSTAGMGDPGKALQLIPQYFSMYADPAWATMWFTSDQVGVWNWQRWTSKDFDALHLQALTTLDPSKRNDMYIQMQQLIDQTCSMLWITHGANVHAFKKTVVPTFTPNGQDQLWYFKGA